MRDEDKTRGRLIAELRSTRKDRANLQALVVRAAYAFDKLAFDHPDRHDVLQALKRQATDARKGSRWT